MSGPNIVFFHVGPETVYPTILVRSIRARNSTAQIVQCTDATGPAIEGVNDVVRFEGDSSLLNKFRVECYTRLPTKAPTLYLDTDMVCLQPLDLEAALDGQEAAVCLRQYNKDMPISVDAMGVDLSEYSGRTLGDVYPYVACTVITDGPRFWNACLDDMRTMPPKFWRWFSDQEAMRNVIDRNGFKVAFLPESIYACLVDVETNPSANPKICHFKGPARKQMMLDFARQVGWLGHNENIFAGAIRAAAPAKNPALPDIALNLPDDDIANLALQRSGHLIAMGGGDTVAHWFETGDKSRIFAFLRQNNLVDKFADAVVREHVSELAELGTYADLSVVKRLASIGPGLCLTELLFYRQQPCDLYLIDIEHSPEHEHGFAQHGSGYANNTSSRSLLTANAVPVSAIRFCNPRKEPLDPAPVDLIISTFSMGFHYPLDEYVDYIDRALRPGGMLIFDKRKHVEDLGWDRLAGKFHTVASLDMGKSWRLILKRV